MTTLTQTPGQTSDNTPQRVTQAKVVRSEWTEFRTQPSAAWSVLTAVALIVGFGGLYSLVRVTRPPRSPADMASFDPTAIGLAGVQLAQIAVGVLGVLLVTSEYATGMIRTSMIAVPRRLPMLWAKAIVLALTAPLLFVPATFATFLVSQSVLSREQLGTSLDHPGVARAVLGSALYLTASACSGRAWGPCCATPPGRPPRCSGCCSASRSWSASCRRPCPTRSPGTCPRRRGSPSPTCGPTRRRSDPGPGSACSACTRRPYSGWPPGCYAAATSDAASTRCRRDGCQSVPVRGGEGHTLRHGRERCELALRRSRSPVRPSGCPCRS
jgi:hypothetical protein